MQQHIAACAQVLAQTQSGVKPGGFKCGVRHIDILKRQVMPFNTARFTDCADAVCLHRLQLVLRHQRHDGSGSPVLQRVDVGRQIALPGAGD